jgi:predicted HTH transcriptional regulator
MKNNIQKKVFEHLVSVFPEQPTVTTAELRQILKISVKQMKQTNKQLKKKGLVISHGYGLLGLNIKSIDVNYLGRRQGGIGGKIPIIEINIR